MYRASVSVVTISKMYGHESIDVTIKYIGVDMDDMTAAMQMSLFQIQGFWKKWLQRQKTKQKLNQPEGNW